ncbi:Protein Iojap/ribosomal silencing factor RsfS [Parasponia andersonii]|uniref:Protein Iojap, chloroplastic n=1 Tax=Parasponia andersonii TaxID=3476 RepID=A0A2P5DV58_PARAD|nr:Protein Iojap/ribosomal silencing factor RsfS [Parasponia andersonii]
MALSLTLSLAGVGDGNRLSGEFWQLGFVEPSFSQSRNKLSSFRFSNCKSFWRTPRSNSSILSSRRFSYSISASGKEAEDGFIQNASEDTDEMFEKLFDRYGKVVFRRNDKKPPSAEVDDDAESLSFAVAMAKVASEVKAGDIKVLFVKPLVYWTRFFIITTAFSRPQIDAIASKMRDLAEKKYGKAPSGDTKPNSWTLLDYGDVVIHIFLPQQRAFYNLEEFYANATPIELPFENQPPPFRG